jgi:hypothetical protein
MASEKMCNNFPLSESPLHTQVKTESVHREKFGKSHNKIIFYITIVAAVAYQLLLCVLILKYFFFQA